MRRLQHKATKDIIAKIRQRMVKESRITKMTAKKNGGRAVKMEYTCQKKGTKMWFEQTTTKEKRCFIAKKVDKKHNLQLFTQAICFAKIKRSPQHLLAQGQHCL